MLLRGPARAYTLRCDAALLHADELEGTIMDMAVERTLEMASVAAPLGYITPPRARPYDYAFEPPAGLPWHNYEIDARPMQISDARGIEPRPTIESAGFTLRHAPSRVRDFLDEDEVRRIYYAEAAQLACAVTGANEAHVFDHLVRRREPGAPALSFGRRVAGDKPSANGRVHNDYTEASGRNRLKLLIEDERAAAAVRRYAIVNIWRSIAGPVLDTPLALCDARTVDADDLVASDVHYATRTGEIYLVRHSPRHRWFFYSAMDRSEALVFKQFDSEVRGVPRFVPHAAFDHPDAPADAPPRESIEVRCLVIYD
jgi:hypothetical protein